MHGSGRRRRRGARVLIAGLASLALLGLSSCIADAAPAIGTAIAGNGQAALSWSRPIGDTGLTVTAYVVTPYAGGEAQPPTSFAPSRRAGTIWGLTNGVTYTFDVVAVGALGGESARSERSNAVVPFAGTGVTEPAYSGAGPRVAIFGDSITYAALPHLHASTQGYSLRVVAWFGEGWSGGELSEALGGSIMRVTAASWAATHPAIVVFSLGTNDAWSPELSLEDALSAMDEMAARFPDACLAGVEVSEISTAPGYQVAEAVAINQAMRARLDVTSTWVTADRLRPDAIHPNEQGQDVFVAAVDDLIAACS
jgi:lysophospholipase L1-like esterase